MRFEEFDRQYRRSTNRKKYIIVACFILAILAGMLEICLGKAEAYQVLWDHIAGNPVDPLDDYIIWERNAPRAVGVVVVGAGLGVCGVAMQSALKNPLADPFMTGIASGASFGVTLAVACGFFVAPFLTGYYGVGLNAFVFSMIPAAAIVGISCMKKQVSPSTMILIGIAITYMFGAFNTMIKLTTDEESFSEIYSWAMGSVGSVTWDTAPFLLFVTVLGIIAFYFLHPQLNLLALDEKMSVSSGLRPKRSRILVVGLASLVTAILVCFTGTIGFVGLVAPHVMRMFMGSDNRFLVPASAACGALVLSASDCLAISLTVTGLPVGVITSLIGGPLFIYILIKQHRMVWA